MASISDASHSETVPRVDYDLIRAHGWAAVLGLLASALFGLAVSLKFHLPHLLSQHAWSTWGRLRYDHTQGILFAWLGNGFLAFLYHALPRLASRPVTSRRLGWVMFWTWNVAAVLPGWTLVLAGVSQPLEWAEFPLGVALVIEIALVLIVVQFVLPFGGAKMGEIYVAGWYLIGGAVFTALAYPVGNLLPHLLPGAAGAAFSGLWIHDAVGLLVTPLTLVIAYYVLPVASGRPVYSHFYSMVGFWLLFLVYPLNGTHHYLFSAIPMAAQRGAVVASIYQGLDVILVVANLLLGLVGVMALVGSDLALRFVWTSVVLYLVVSVQGSLQAVMRFNRAVHFSDWVIGHSHLAMIGFASFGVMGGLAHIWERLPGTRFSRRALGWSYWLMTTGLLLMVVDLSAAGLVQAALWHSSLSWMTSVRASRDFWLFRSVDGMLLLAGFGAFALSLFTGPRRPGPWRPHSPPPSPFEATVAAPSALPGASWLRSVYVWTFAAGVIFFVLSFVVLGVLPARALEREMAAGRPADDRGYTAAELRGRMIYGRDGCAYCHTQQIRSTPDDVRRFGLPSAAWETAHDYPQLWGTRRIGPDLAREALQHPADWQLVHLFNPQSVVPDSVMPPFPWLFDGAATKPSQDAVDLVAYLRTLGQAANLQAPAAATTPVVQIDTTPTPSAQDPMGFMPVPSAPALPARAANLVFDAHDPGQLQVGAAVFRHNCSGCHGAAGRGDTAAALALLPHALNLTAFRFSAPVLERVLNDGVPGSAMPLWRELSPTELQGVAAFVTALGPTEAAPAAPDEVGLRAGAAVYATHCAACHGGTGQGNGVMAGVLRPLPANFHVLQPSLAQALQAVQQGVPGTAMPAWPNLTAAEVQAVVAYVRSLYGIPANATSLPAQAPRGRP